MAPSRNGEFFERLIELDGPGFASSLRAAGIGIWYFDIADGIQHFNSHLLDLYGFGADEVLSREDGFARILHPDDRARARRLADQRLADNTAGDVVTRVRRADGRYIACIAHGTPLRDSDGALTRVIGVLRDRDEVARAEARLRESELMAHLGHWSIDLVADEVIWSDGTYAIYGYEPGSVELDLEFVHSHYAPGELPRVMEIIENGLAERAPFEFRTRIVVAGGDERHVRVIGRVDVDADGRPALYSGVVQDITDEVVREAQVRQSQKMEAIGNMTGGAAHDFNNLLAVIMGNLELVRDRLDDTELVEHCDAAIAAALNGADLTRSMLSFARQAQLNPTTVDLNDIVRGLARWTRRTLPATVETEVSLMAGLWKTEIDTASAESALLNLILNARDAMPDGGKLTIETANVRIDDDYIASRDEDIDPGRYVMLAVSDTGHGITDDHLDRIFEPFYSTKETGRGTGLGLSTVQGFVKQSNGAIRVYTEPGVGTTFKLYFRARTTPGDTTTPISARAHTHTAGAHILVAEDEPDVLQLLVTTLTRAGYRVTPATSGDEAKAIFEQDPSIDLLLTDIVMPGQLQGTDLARHLRHVAPTLPAIFMSGYANEATVHGNGLRPEDIRLMKPVRISDLLNAITAALEEHRAEGDETPNDETPNDETPKDETPNHETPNHETPNDETPNDETPNDDDDDRSGRS